MAEKKHPLPEDTCPKQLVHHSHVPPSAPPMDVPTNLGQPPSYEQACVAAREVTAPVPYYVPLQPGKGCVLLLQTPCPDVDYVGQCFKRHAANMLLHDGKVVAFIPKFDLFPSRDMSAVLIYFDAQRIALSWLQNISSAAPELTSKWLAMAIENKTKVAKPDWSQHKAISIVVMKRLAGFVDTKAYTDEQAKLRKEKTNPLKARYGVVSLVSGEPVFACGDWSAFPAKASELLVNITQHRNLDTRKAYVQEFVHNPQLKRSNELTGQKYSYLFNSAFPLGEIGKFQDL